MKPPKCLGQYNKESAVCRWFCRIVAYGTHRECKRSVCSSGNGARALQEEHLERGNPMRTGWYGDYAPPEERIENSVQPPPIPRVRGIANVGGWPIELVPGPADDNIDVERGTPMRPMGPRDMPCFGHYDPRNYSCTTACMAQLECMRETGIANPQRSCLGKFDNFPTGYHDEHCAACSQNRVCIHQAGIQNALIGSFHVIAKPAEAPTCFGRYYEHTSDSNEPDCEDWCRFFTDCIRTTLSAENFFQELQLPTDEIDNYQDSTPERREEMRSGDLESRQEKAMSLEVVPAGDTFLVKSSTRKGGYMVTPEDDGTYHCACMDYATHRGDPEWRCKHIIAVEMYLEERGPTSSDSRWGIIDVK